MQALAVGGDAGFHGPAEALPQVEPVGDLEGVGGTESGTLGVGARPVAADDLHAGMSGQPRGQRPRFTCPEHIDHAMGFSAGQHGGVGLLPADREVVHAEHARRSELRIRQRHDPAQQGHPPCLEAQLASQTGASPSGKREPDASQDVVEPRDEACVRGGQLSERLGERTASAIPRITDETPDRQPDHDTLLTKGKIPQPALIGVVHPAREATAVRTRRPGRPTSRHHIDRAEGSGHRLDVHVVDPVEHERVPERCVGLHDQHRHRPQPRTAETAEDLTERHSQRYRGGACAVSREPEPSQSNTAVTLRHRTPRSVPEPTNYRQNHAAVVDAGYLPEDDDQELLPLLFLTEQFERYDREDPNGTRLRAILAEKRYRYEHEHFRTVAERAGRPDPWPPKQPSPSGDRTSTRHATTWPSSFGAGGHF